MRAGHDLPGRLADDLHVQRTLSSQHFDDEQILNFDEALGRIRHKDATSGDLQSHRLDLQPGGSQLTQLALGVFAGQAVWT